MPERTYLYSYGNDKDGYGPFRASKTRRTREYILSRPGFQKVHPGLMSRLFDLADAVIDAGSDYGFGSGWRSSEQQMTVFTQRYTRGANGVGVYWDGSPSWPNLAGWYTKNPGVAPSAPPGRSYHESTTKSGLALAVDMVGDHKVGNELAARFQVKHFGDVNSEPWHYQPTEIPNARRNYRGEFENVVPPPPPPIQDIPEEDEMDPDKMILWRPKGFQNILIVTTAGVFHASLPLLKAFRLPTDAAGINARVVEDDHPQTLKSMLVQAGLTFADLVKAV